MKVSACEIVPHPLDPKRLDIIIPSEQHYHLKVSAAMRQSRIAGRRHGSNFLASVNSRENFLLSTNSLLNIFPYSIRNDFSGAVRSRPTEMAGGPGQCEASGVFSGNSDCSSNKLGSRTCAFREKEKNKASFVLRSTYAAGQWQKHLFARLSVRHNLLFACT